MNVHDFSMKTIRGETKKLADFKGKVLLIVNVASRCGLTPQYSGLQALYEKYQGKGFEVLGFPANNFLAQEPGTDQEIQTFCSTKYNVTFPMFAKISVKGDDINPLYKHLTTESAQPGEIQWNFQKFLVDRSGHVVANISPRTEPQELAAQIEKLLD